MQSRGQINPYLRKVLVQCIDKKLIPVVCANKGTSAKRID